MPSEYRQVEAIPAKATAAKGTYAHNYVERYERPDEQYLKPLPVHKVPGIYGW
jgi:hypothetical protein